MQNYVEKYSSSHSMLQELQADFEDYLISLDTYDYPISHLTVTKDFEILVDKDIDYKDFENVFFQKTPECVYDAVSQLCPASIPKRGGATSLEL